MPNKNIKPIKIKNYTSNEDIIDDRLYYLGEDDLVDWKYKLDEPTDCDLYLETLSILLGPNAESKQCTIINLQRYISAVRLAKSYNEKVKDMDNADFFPVEIINASIEKIYNISRGLNEDNQFTQKMEELAIILQGLINRGVELTPILSGYSSISENPFKPCVAYAIFKDDIYFALSGFKNDRRKIYYNCKELLAKRLGIAEPDILDCFRYDEVLVYTETSRCDGKDKGILIKKPKTRAELISKGVCQKIVNFATSCCERKILTEIFNKHGFKINATNNPYYFKKNRDIMDLVVRVRWEPCDRCKPSLYGTENIYYLFKSKSLEVPLKSMQYIINNLPIAQGPYKIARTYRWTKPFKLVKV